MRRFETPYVADWFAISLRWLALVGIIILLGLSQSLTITFMWPLMGLVLWNLGMSTLAALSVRISYHRVVSFLVDVALAGAFFWMQGGLDGPAKWVGLLPILTGAVYFEFLGGLLAALIIGAFVMVNFKSPSSFSFNLSSEAYTFTGILTLVGLFFGFMGRILVSNLRRSRTQHFEAEDRRRRVENERMRAIYELTSTLSTTLNYKRVLDSALDMGFSALNPDDENPDTMDINLVGAVLLFKGGELRIGSARRFTSPDMRMTFEGNEGILKRIFDEGDPVLTENISYDPELGRVVAFRNCTSAYCFPLRSGFNVYGALVFAHKDPTYFIKDRCELLDIIGRQAVVAIQNARLYQDLVEEKERMVEVHEEARKKLARDLHDGPTQSVAAMAMRLNLTKRMLAKDPKMAADEIVKLEEMAHRTTKEIRHMLFTLRPLVLESQGLTAALKQMADKMKETYNQNVTINVDENTVFQLEIGKQGVMFYIAEEAVNNARKHAQAPVIAVNLRTVETGIALLEIVDNGVGFDMQEMARSYERRANSSLGMVNLRERAELVNGLFHMESAPGQGTRVQVYIPLNEEASDRLHHGRR